MRSETDSSIYKDFKAQSLGELYHQASRHDDTVVMRLINQIWLLQDLLNDETCSHNRTRERLRELRKQLKINPPSEEGGSLSGESDQG